MNRRLLNINLEAFCSSINGVFEFGAFFLLIVVLLEIIENQN